MSSDFIERCPVRVFLFLFLPACVLEAPAPAIPANAPAIPTNASAMPAKAHAAPASTTRPAPDATVDVRVALAVPPPPTVHLTVDAQVPAVHAVVQPTVHVQAPPAEPVAASPSCAAMLVGAGYSSVDAVHCQGVTDLACAAEVLRSGDPVELVHCD